jgi:hypothetical protein
MEESLATIQMPRSTVTGSNPNEGRIVGSWEEYQLDRLREACKKLKPTHDEQLSMAQILDAARKRERICTAILDFAYGGAKGLFDAYEAISYEIMNAGFLNYSASVGTREWLIQEGLISDQEEDRFLRTVMHFRNPKNRLASPDFLSPDEANRFVRQILLGFIRLCVSSDTKQVPAAR